MSICTLTGLDLSYYVRVALKRVWQIQALRHWKAASVEGFQSYLANCSCKNVVFVDRLGMKGLKVVYQSSGRTEALPGSWE